MNCGIKDRFVSIYIKLKDAYESDIHIYEGKDDINIDKFKKGFNYGQKKALLKNFNLIYFIFIIVKNIKEETSNTNKGLRLFRHTKSIGKG